ncbi:MAG TPA: methyltransferase domain-containing protein [Puia sp.]|nr:methyltransferase domain-containing protein [Puia sp.]
MEPGSYPIFEDQFFAMDAGQPGTKFYDQLAVDFDDTLFKDAGNIEELRELVPMEGAAQYTKLLHEEGFEIVIYTCRPHYHRKYLQGLMKKHGIYHDYILFYTKPRADFYIDNKAIHFTTWAHTYREVHLRKSAILGLQQPFNHYEKILQKQKIKYLRKTDKMILDVGCGDGSVFDGTDYFVIGFDTDEKALELCRKVRSYKACTSEKPDDEMMRKFDIVTILGVLEHVEDPGAFLDLFSQAREIYITVPNAMSFHRHVGKFAGIISDLQELSPQDIAIGHKRYFTPMGLSNLLKHFCDKHSFEITVSGTTGMKFTTSQEMERFCQIAVNLDSAAEYTGLIGINKFYGAEIFANLVKQ